MKKLLTLVIALAMLTLPMAIGLAEATAAPAETATASDGTVLVKYEATDLGFSFYYPQTWNAPVVDATDPTSLTLSHSSDNATILVKKIVGSALTTDQLVANMDTFKASIVAQNATAKFDDAQSGQIIKMPNGDAVQQVYYITTNNVEVFSALYYLSLGDSLYICQLSVPSNNAQVQTYLSNLGMVLGSLTLL